MFLRFFGIYFFIKNTITRKQIAISSVLMVTNSSVKVNVGAFGIWTKTDVIFKRTLDRLILRQRRDTAPSLVDFFILNQSN